MLDAEGGIIHLPYRSIAHGRHTRHMGQFRLHFPKI
jgi:hypothetical protein